MKNNSNSPLTNTPNTTNKYTNTQIYQNINIPEWVKPTPFLTVDGIVRIFAPEFKGIVLIKRKYPPLGYALPGGFVDYGESVEDAIRREMREELNLDVEIVKLLGIYSNPNRDERVHTASCVFICNAYEMPQAGDDTKEAFIIKLEDIEFKKLAFDHAKILKDYIKS